MTNNYGSHRASGDVDLCFNVTGSSSSSIIDFLNTNPGLIKTFCYASDGAVGIGCDNCARWFYLAPLITGLNKRLVGINTVLIVRAV